MKKNIKKLSLNKQKIENYIAIIILLIISGFIIFFSSSLYLLAFKANDTNFLKNIVTSFAGAFFAFLFLRIGEVLGKYYQRQVKHFNALVSLEIFSDELGSIIHDNVCILPEFRKTISSGGVFTSTLNSLPIRKDYYEQLNDIKLINEVYKLNYDIRRMNDDQNTAVNWHIHLRELYTTGKITPEHYIENAKILSENLKVVQAGLVLLLEDTIRLNAIVKIRADLDKPLLTRAMNFLMERIKQDISESQIKHKIITVKKEVKKSGTDSQPRIEKIKEMVESYK